MVGPSQMVVACAKEVTATSQASAALLRKKVEDDLNIFIANVRFRNGFSSRFFCLVETVENIGGIKGLATGPRGKNWHRLDLTCW